MYVSPWKREIESITWVEMHRNKRDRWQSSGREYWETTEMADHLGDYIETWCNGNSQESTEVTQIRLLAIEHIEPDLAIFCNQARLLVERLVHQCSHITFDLNFVLHTRCAGLNVAWQLKKKPNNDLSRLRHMPQETYASHDTVWNARTQKLGSSKTQDRTKQGWQKSQ